MNVREFAAGDHIQFGVGTNGLSQLLFGAFTVLIICKRISGHTQQGALLDFANGLSGSRGFFRYQDNTTGNQLNYLRGQFDSAGDGPAFTTSDGWCAIAFRKSDGTATTTYSKGVKGVSSTTWTHQTTVGDVDDDSTTCDRLQTRFMEDNDWAANFRVAAYAIWTSNLADGTLESLDSSYPDIIAAGPIWAIKFDQASTATAVTDDIADADQSALVGSTVVTTDDPPNWIYEAVAGEQDLNVGFHQQVNQIFAPTIQNQANLNLSVGFKASSSQIFLSTITNQANSNLLVAFKSSSATIFQPTINNEGDELFEPILLGNGSLADRILAGLIDQGFLSGSLADREYLRLLNKLGLAYTGAQTLADLYELAAEDNRIAGLELFGAALP